MKNRESFVIYKNWVDAINRLPEECQLEIYKALMEYGLTGKMPDNVSTICSAMLVSFSVSLENSINRYLASVENGKKGGNPNFKKGVPNPYYAKKTTTQEPITTENEQNKNTQIYIQNNATQNEDFANGDMFTDLDIIVCDDFISQQDSLKGENLQEKDNQKITQDNLNITQDNLGLPMDNLNVNVNVNDNVNDKDNDKKENSLTRVKESEKNSLSPARKKEKHKYGQFKNVLLTEDEYNSLLLKPDGKEAIEYLSYHREMKGYKCKDDNLAIQKWVFDAIKEQRQRKARLESSGLQKSNGLQKESPMTQLGRVLGSNTTGAKM